MDFAWRRVLPLASCSLASLASAQWQALDLHPSGRTWSRGDAMIGAKQGGSAQNRAGVWSGSAGTWVELHPVGAFDSRCWGVSSSQEVGQVNVGGLTQASLWQGSSGTWTSLHPPDSTLSVAFACIGNQQVGFATIAGVNRAGIWTGTSGSWLDVHPAGSTDSRLLCTNGASQGGYARMSGSRRASLWSGSAASWTDLTPSWAGDGIVYALDEHRQVGTAGFRACLWYGTPLSAVSLHPDGAAQSFAFAGYRGVQAGGVIFTSGGPERASVWFGTKESRTDLHQFLPPGFTSSEARAVWRDARYVYVFGYATLPSLDSHAVLWRRKFPGALSAPGG